MLYYTPGSEYISTQDVNVWRNGIGDRVRPILRNHDRECNSDYSNVCIEIVQCVEAV